MKNYNLVFLIFFTLYSSFICADEKLSNIFDGVVKQSHDYSCGSAALATLILGTIENSNISEKNIIEAITGSTESKEEKGFSATDLENATKKFGYKAKWKNIYPSELEKVKPPVLLIIGLNSKFPHYVVLKGIRNKTAFLADPIRGNIRIPYEKLIEEGLNEKIPAWFVMAVIPSNNKPKESTLYLSEIESERQANHVTVEQSSAITLATLPTTNQVIADYSFKASLGNNKRDGVKINSETFSHVLNARYGVTDNLEIGGSIRYSDNTTDISFDNNKISLNNSDRQYSLYGNHRFKLDDSGGTSIILGVNGSYAEKNDVFGGGFNIVGYQNTEFAQIILGGSFGKEFSHNHLVDNSLPDYFYSGFIGANKPLGDRYLASVNFAINDGKSKNKTEKFDRSYSASTSLTYVINKQFQISPSFTYSFGSGEVFSFGMNIAYVGGW